MPNLDVSTVNRLLFTFHCRRVSADARLLLALALLVLCVFADHANHPAAVDDLALDANLFY